MKIELVQDSSAKSLLISEQFQLQWCALWDQCPWATAFQKYGFARAWYSIYGNEFTPLLLISRNASGALDGLLALAEASDGQYVIAGGVHAEYHCWISTPALGDVFPVAAFETLHRQLRPGPITFDFLAPQAPIQWLTHPEMKRLAFFKPFYRPVLEFGEGDTLQQSLNKGHTKQKFRRLGQLGELSFTRITCAKEFDALFDEMVILYDLRHGAVQATAPFCSIPQQKDFHLAMMKTPDLFHVTALRVGNRLAAAHWGTCGKQELHMGTLVFEPSFVRHSPGRLLILRLAQMLKQDGFQRLDLTPGGDAYKDLFASKMEPVYRLTILPTAVSKIRFAATEHVRQSVVRVGRAFGTTPVQARVRLQNFPKPRQIIPCLIHCAGRWLLSRQETRVYYCHPRETPSPAECPQIRRDHLGDLLAYQAPHYGLTRQQFLSVTLQKLEENQHVYTAAKAGQLLHLAWVVDQPDEEQISRWLTDSPLPPHRMLVHDWRILGESANWNLAESLLKTIIHDAACQSPEMGLFLTIPSKDADLHHMAEQNGFRYLCSQRQRTVLGRHHNCIDNPYQTTTVLAANPPMEIMRDGKIKPTTPKQSASALPSRLRQLQPVKPSHD